MSSTEKCDCFIVVQYIIIIVLVRIGLLTWMGVLPFKYNYSSKYWREQSVASQSNTCWRQTAV